MAGEEAGADLSAKTGIEWTDSTWNPVRGCSRVSEGCRNCYAEGIAARFSGVDDRGNAQPFSGLAEHVVSNGRKEARWTGEVKLVEEHLLDPLRWKRPRKIFVNSMSDLFHEKVPDEWIDRIFALMALSPQHTFQVLTKRPERMLEYVGARPQAIWDRRALAIDPSALEHLKALPWPVPNVWLGVSVEDQATADERIQLLLQTPAAIRFVSYEPALGPVSFRWLSGFDYKGTLRREGSVGEYAGLASLDWIICGGESGPHARPMNPQWARDVRDQCAAAGVAYFHKQNGEYVSVSEVEGLGEHFTFPDHRTVRRVGKKAAGRLLDGVEHSAFPLSRRWADAEPVADSLPFQ